MELTDQDAEKLVRTAYEALRAGRPAEARSHLERVTAGGRAPIQVWFLLATACRIEGDLAAEEAAVDHCLAIDARSLQAHLMKADCRSRSGDEGGALKFYTSAMMLGAGQRVPPELHGELGRAERAAAAIKERQAAAREASLAAKGVPAGSRSRRFEQSLDIIAGRKQIFVQEPTVYYFPELPQVQFYDPALFDWVPAVEAATATILEEVRPVFAGGREGFRPYIQSARNEPRLDDNPLVDNDDWSALFLCRDGKVSDEAIARFPLTWAAMQQVPAPWIEGSAPTIMFSLLRAGTRINPHTGMHNTRLICHLPLIVPPGCGFRVGNEVREWEVGKLLIFDDTIEHEAWNDGSEDRMVLIFEIWRPELNQQERREVAALFGGQAVS